MSTLPREIGVVTSSRADFGLYQPVLRALDDEPGTRPRLLVTGMHTLAGLGHTLDEVRASGFEVFDVVESADAERDDAAGVAAAIGRGTSGFARVFDRWRPDVLLVLGDRYDMLPAALAALPFAIPTAHIGGGETTAGAIDESIRHALTKLAHVHFVSNPLHGQRLVRMGEEPWRVHVTGSPAVDALLATARLSDAETRERAGLPADGAYLVVTFHPVTRQPAEAGAHVAALLHALDEVALPVVFTAPNADTRYRELLAAVEAFIGNHPRSRLLRHAGTSLYLSLVAHAAAVVGNSSSALLEAPSLRAPAVDVGARQQGRLAGDNVVRCECEREVIVGAIRRATAPAFRAALSGSNPYGDGAAAPRIARVLAELALDDALLLKRFYDGEG